MIDAIRATLIHHPDYLKWAVLGLLYIGACALFIMLCQFAMNAQARYRQGKGKS